LLKFDHISKKKKKEEQPSFEQTSETVSAKCWIMQIGGFQAVGWQQQIPDVLTSSDCVKGTTRKWCLAENEGVIDWPYQR